MQGLACVAALTPQADAKWSLDGVFTPVRNKQLACNSGGCGGLMGPLSETFIRHENATWFFSLDNPAADDDAGGIWSTDQQSAAASMKLQRVSL